MNDTTVEKARIVSIKGSTVQVRGLSSYRMGEITYVGEEKLIGEIIEIENRLATVQVYEPLEGLRINDPIYPTGKSLSAELGPGLLTNIFDGIQRPLEFIKSISKSSFIKKGIQVNALDRKRKWTFIPNQNVKKGEIIRDGDKLGSVKETPTIDTMIMAPPKTHGELIEIQDKGEYTITEPLVTIRDKENNEKVLTLMHEWPVRIARPFFRKIPVYEPLITGQRIIDMFFPIAKGGTAAIPGAFGTGKCVDGKTPILLTNGETSNIEDLYKKSITSNSKILKDTEEETILDVIDKNIEIFSFDRENAKIVKKKVSKIYRGKTNSMVKIITRKGRSISVTPIHKLQIYDGQKVIEKEARTLSIGDFLLCPRKLHVQDQNNLKINYSLIKNICNLRLIQEEDKEKICEILDEIKEKYNKTLKSIAKDINVNYDVLLSIYRKKTNPAVEVVNRILNKYNIEYSFKSFKTERRSKKVILPSQISNELAEFLGLLLSDGRLSLDRVIQFYNNDDFLRKRFTQLARQLFSVESKEIIANTVKTVVIYSKPLTSFLQSMGIPLIKKSRNIKIPLVIMRSSDEILLHFLNAYISGDGFVSNYTLEISTASSKMSSDLGYVLSRLGILYRISRKRTKNHIYYRIGVEGSQLQELSALMSFSNVTNYEKTMKILEYANKQTAHFEISNAIPIKKQILISNHQQILDSSSSIDKEKALQIISNVKQNQKVTRTTLQVFSETLKQVNEIKNELITSNLEKIDYILDLHTDFYFDQIKKIEFLNNSQLVYDLTIPETENFIGGDYPLILHNTVIQHQLSKWSNADVVIYIGCGERGNEMTDVLREFPKLVDPHTKNPLMDRTLLIANVSNMPVAAREASIYMGVTMAEYFRDQGFNVLLTADSTSRWAEALREISGQLEEMPVEEGYPAYLGARLANFYERAGHVIAVGSPYREGSVNITAAVSPPGGDFSEPVTANTMRFVKTFWGLDPTLANRKHFPSINWFTSYSGYIDVIEEWALESGLEDWGRYRYEMFSILQKDNELQQIVELIGSKALPADEQLTILIADIIKDGFLQQSAFHPVDSFCPIEKQMTMMKLILLFYHRADILIKNGCPISLINNLKSVQILKRMKEDVPNDNLIQLNKIEDYIHSEMEELGSKYSYKV